MILLTRTLPLVTPIRSFIPRVHSVRHAPIPSCLELPRKSILLLQFTSPPVPITARMHSTPQRPFAPEHRSVTSKAGDRCGLR
eukprot:1175552-Prorocentrum_minimum.AAC.3